MIEGYSDRAMNSGSSSGRDGHPTGGTCPKCGAKLYYASRLKLHDRVLENVDYCSGGCGHYQPTLQAECAAINEAFASGAKEVIAAVDQEGPKN